MRRELGTFFGKIARRYMELKRGEDEGGKKERMVGSII